MADGSRYGKYGKLLLYLAVVVLVNIAGLTLFFRVDLTANRVYSLSETSRRVVSTLSEPLTINVFFTRNLPAPYNGVERYLRDLLEEYAIHASPHFNYRFYDVEPEQGDVGGVASENRRMADNYGITPVQIQAVERDEVKFKRAYMGLVMIHGDQVERVPTITATDGLEYRITTAIQKLNNKVSALLALDGDIEVVLYMSSSLERIAGYMGLEELPQFPERLGEVVETLNGRTYGRLQYRRVDPADAGEAESLAREYGVLNLKWPAIPEENIEAGGGVIGLVMTYGEKVLSMPLMNVYRLPLLGTQYELADIDGMERAIGDSIETLVDINQNLGYLADFGTPALFGGRAPQGGAMNAFNRLASQTYSFRQVRLKEETIPESLESLVVVRPTEAFSDYALYQIDQALMRGTNLALFLDAFTEPTGPGGRPLGPMGGGPTAFDSGLERLLEHYGIRIADTIVLDENCYKQTVGQEFGGGEQAIYFAPLIQSERIDHSLSFMKNIKGLITLQVSPLEADEEKLAANGLTAHRLFSSSEKSWEMGEPVRLDPMAITPPRDESEMESRPLAYVIEGAFPSYFAGKPVPEKPAEEEGAPPGDAPADGDATEPAPAGDEAREAPRLEGAAPTIEKGVPAKIFIIASSEMVQDRILDQEGQSPNAMFVMNVIDYLNGREDVAVMRSKVQRFNPLDPVGGAARTAIKTAALVGLPVLVVLVGLAVWLRRTARKKRIQQRFSPRPAGAPATAPTETRT
jgi:ABC-type uncharacterized transport system involved in gliding motility auxiliary subunit